MGRAETAVNLPLAHISPLRISPKLVLFDLNVCMPFYCTGKSSVINALLGKKYLAEGILPTTNEISILR